MDTRRSIAAVALAGLVFLLAMKIPLPGIDIAAVAARMGGDGNALSRLSIFALGLMPLYTALILVELGRLFVRSDDSLPRSPGTTERMIVAVIALAFTGLQGYGITVGFNEMGLVGGDAGHLTVLIVATYMGITALTVFLCYRIRIPGFRHAFWALWSIPVLLSMPYDIGAILQMTRTGALSGTAWLGFLAYFLVCVAAVSVMAALWKSVCLQRVETADGTVGVFAEPKEILIWPSILASMVLQLVLTIMAFVAPGTIENWMGSFRIMLPIISVVFIPVFVFAYLRRNRGIIRPGAPVAFVATVIAVIQIALLIVEMIRMTTLPYSFGLGSTAMLALTLTALSLGKAHVPQSIEAEQAEA